MQAYADMGAAQRAHLLAEDFVGALVLAAHRIIDRGIPRDVHPPEQLALFRAISVLMRRRAPPAGPSLGVAPSTALRADGRGGRRLDVSGMATDMERFPQRPNAYALPDPEVGPAQACNPDPHQRLTTDHMFHYFLQSHMLKDKARWPLFLSMHAPPAVVGPARRACPAGAVRPGAAAVPAVGQRRHQRQLPGVPAAACAQGAPGRHLRLLPGDERGGGCAVLQPGSSRRCTDDG